MKLAILIMSHRLPEQVAVLCNCLKHNDIDIFIHIDKKVDELRQDIIDQICILFQLLLCFFFLGFKSVFNFILGQHLQFTEL